MTYIETWVSKLKLREIWELIKERAKEKDNEE